MELHEGNVLQYPFENCSANFINLVGSRVEVLTVNQAKYVGCIYSMDPISGSLFIMADNHQEERSIKLVIGSSIRCLKILKASPVNARNLISESNNPSAICQPRDDMKQLKESLKRWLIESHVPVNENIYGCLLVLNEISISAPYRPENCSGTNQVMLWRVQKMVENFYQK